MSASCARKSWRYSEEANGLIETKPPGLDTRFGAMQKISRATQGLALSVKRRSAVVRSAVFVPNCHRRFGCDYDPSVAEVPFSAVLLFSQSS